MSITTTCDFCHEPIIGSDKVQILIDDPGAFKRGPDEGTESLFKRLDLHVACYVTHYQPTIERTQ